MRNSATIWSPTNPARLFQRPTLIGYGQGPALDRPRFLLAKTRQPNSDAVPPGHLRPSSVRVFAPVARARLPAPTPPHGDVALAPAFAVASVGTACCTPAGPSPPSLQPDTPADTPCTYTSPYPAALRPSSRRANARPHAAAAPRLLRLPPCQPTPRSRSPARFITPAAFALHRPAAQPGNPLNLSPVTPSSTRGSVDGQDRTRPSRFRPSPPGQPRHGSRNRPRATATTARTGSQHGRAVDHG